MPGQNDPYAPDYAPEHAGSPGVDDVGSGATFGADLYKLYYAGRVLMPDTARSYAHLGISVNQMRSQISSLTINGIPELMPLLEVQADLNVGFAKTSQHCEAAGSALVRIADEYVRTDEEAAENFERWVTTLSSPEEQGRMGEPPIEVPDVPISEEN